MNEPDPARVHELVTRFAASKRAMTEGVAQRRAIVAELLALRSRSDVARLLCISTQRVSEIAGKASSYMTPAETVERYGVGGQ